MSVQEQSAGGIDQEHPASEEQQEPKTGKQKAKLKITVESEQAPHEGLVTQPADTLVAIPTSVEMGQMLEAVRDFGDMKRLHDLAAAWERAGEQMKVAYEVVFKAAELRIRLERQMGSFLAQSVRRGGHSSKLGGLTSNRGGCSAGLPDGISGERAHWYKRVAKVSDSVFAAYLDQQRNQLEQPTSKGLVRFAGAVARKNNGIRKKSAADEAKTASPSAMTRKEICQRVVQTGVLEAVKRILTVDVVIGGNRKAFTKAQHFNASLLKERDLRGNVLVLECPEPESWLPKLAASKGKQGVVQVVVIVPAQTFAPWFKQLEVGKWACCFLRDAAIVVAYIGDKRRAFWEACQDLGTTMLAGVPVECTY